MILLAPTGYHPEPAQVPLLPTINGGSPCPRDTQASLEDQYYSELPYIVTESEHALSQMPLQNLQLLGFTILFIFVCLFPLNNAACKILEVT